MGIMEDNVMKRRNGFTLAELLIVVAIIAALVVIGIPIFTKQLEKSRESADAANIRAAYAEVMSAAVADDRSSSLWDGTNWKCEEQLLKQKKDDWQNASMKDSLNNLGTQDGKPSAGGSFYVSYDPDAGEGTHSVTIHYSAGSNGGETSAAFDWPSVASIGANARSLMTSGVERGVIYTADNDMTAEQKKMIDDIRKKLGITGDVTVHYGWGIYPNVKVSIVEKPLSKSGFQNKGQYSEGTYATRIDYNPNTGEVVKVIKQYGKWGYNGAQGVGFWANDMNGKYPTEVLYEKE